MGGRNVLSVVWKGEGTGRAAEDATEGIGWGLGALPEFDDGVIIG